MEVRIVEPMPSAVRARHELIERARHLYHAAGRAKFRRRLQRLKVPDHGLSLNFGWLEEPRRAEEARIGGGVKLTHLRDRFGESRDSLNVLYLVSSVLHLVPHAETLVDWAKSNGVRVVWNQNGVAYPAWCGDRYPWFNAPMRRLIAKADYVIYQSEFCRTSADRYLGKVNVPTEVLWNPVDISRFAPAGNAPPMNTWQLLAIGTCHAFYRAQASLDCLAELLRRGVSARLTLAGELRWPNAAEEVNAYIARHGLRDHVALRSRFTQCDAPELYRAAHVVLHPKYKDPCPTVPIEAMACGVPVVGSRSGGTPELVSPDAGVLVDVEDVWTRDVPPDPAAMADAVCTIMNDHAAFSKSARKRARGFFDREKWCDRHREIFEMLLR